MLALTDPLGQPDHGQAFAAALGVPDDAAFAALHTGLRRLYAEVLVVAADLLDARIEDDEIVDDLQQPLLAAELAQLPKQRIVVSTRMGLGFFPVQPVFLRCLDHAVAQTLSVVARHHELHGGEERLDEFLLLAVEVLANTLGH